MTELDQTGRGAIRLYEEPKSPPQRRALLNALWYTALALGVLTALAVVHRPGFLLFHSFAEAFTIVVAISTGLVAWNARPYFDNDYLLFVGIGHMFVALIDFLHMLAFEGMGVFVNGGAPLSTQFWIAARFLGSTTLVGAAFFIARRLSRWYVMPAFAAVTALLIAAIFTGRFPVCFNGEQTVFKIASEYLVAALYVVAAVLLFRRRRAFDPVVMKLVLASIVIRAVAELLFAIYSAVDDTASFAGHYLRIIAFFLLYRAIVVTGIVRPFSMLMRDLRGRENELRGSLKELEAFSYSVSHDLRSPVAVISGFAQMLEWHEADRLSDEGKGYVAQIRGAAQRMGELIDDLLSFALASRSAIEVAPVDMSALAREVADRLRQAEPQRQVEITVEESLVGKADPRLLRIVFDNLIGNAWKFTAKRSPARIEIGATKSGGERSFFVRDDGAGFDMREAEGRLFRPFQRFHAAGDFSGSGVGLATVARIIMRHGGRVWVESEIDRGTTIYFALPE